VLPATCRCWGVGVMASPAQAACLYSRVGSCVPHVAGSCLSPAMSLTCLQRKLEERSDSVAEKRGLAEEDSSKALSQADSRTQSDNELVGATRERRACFCGCRIRLPCAVGGCYVKVTTYAADALKLIWLYI
jgi:hypothetical protein